MGEHEHDDATVPPAPEATVAPPAEAVVTERVSRGLLFALAAVLGGLVLTVVVWRLGYIASITSLVMAAGAVWLYQLGATAAPRKGLVPLVLLIVLGVVASFFGIVASDLWQAYDDLSLTGGRGAFVSENIFNGDLLKEYGKDFGMFALFAALGTFGVLRQVMSRSA